MIGGMTHQEFSVDAVRVRALLPEDHEPVTALLASAGRNLTDAVSRSGSCAAVVAVPPGQVIGFGTWWHVRLAKFRMDLFVAPQSRRRGVGSRLLDHVLAEARTTGAATLQARAGSEDRESLAFLHARGFAETMRMHRQVLQVPDANLAAHEHLPARLAEQGVVLELMDQELARRPDGWQEFCRLYNAAREGWLDPDPGPETPLTPSELRRRHEEYVQEHGVDPGQCYLAVRADRYVGFTGALGTAVDPAFRGQKIATALKLRAISFARDHGVARLETGSGNPAMLAVNARLGFKLTSTEVRLVRPLARPASRSLPEPS